jgi:magnesium chelatase family protein
MRELLPGLCAPAACASPPSGPGNAVATPTHVELQRRVAVARTQQQCRASSLNARLPVQRLAEDCALDSESRKVLEQCQQPMKLTGRGLHRILRVARTIADLEACSTLQAAHVAEAIQFHRPMV